VVPVVARRVRGDEAAGVVPRGARRHGSSGSRQGAAPGPRPARRRTPARGAGRPPSGRAQCRHCKQKIEKGAWRIALTYFEDGRFTPAGSLHVPCAGPYFETIDILPRVKRFAPGLTEADLQEIEAELAKPGP